MLENRFLQSFCAVAASAVLVCGTLLLLTSTAPWSPSPQIVSEASTPDSVRQGEASLGLQVPGASHASDQADTIAMAEPDEANRTFTASTGKEPDEERSQVAEPETSSRVGDDALAAAGMPLNPDTIDTDPENVGADSATVGDTASVSDGATVDEAPPEIALAAPPEPEAPVVSHNRNAATEQIAGMLAALPPRPIASEKSNAATDQIADVLAALPPAPPVPPTPVASDKSDAATVEVAAVLASTPPAPAVVAVIAPPPPLPTRKPTDGPSAPKQAALPAPRQDKPSQPEQTKKDVAQNEEAQSPGSKGPWKPMALAPADKPSIALSKAPAARPSAGAYASKVWSALARHKPRAGQRGSATVAFSIGDNGALRGVRIGRSSGNTRLDQLALATVRNAAPYPPPPSGAVSYSIRIDFQ